MRDAAKATNFEELIFELIFDLIEVAVVAIFRQTLSAALIAI
jgi:hypothetical protein